MLTQNTQLTLDINTAGIRGEVWTKQDDVGTRQITANYVDGGKEVTLSSVTSAELRVLRPDGAMVVSEAEVSNNIVSATFPENALSVSGEGYGDLRLFDDQKNCISASRFILHIEAAAVSNIEASQKSDFAALFDGIEEEIDNLETTFGADISALETDVRGISTQVYPYESAYSGDSDIQKNQTVEIVTFTVPAGLSTITVKAAEGIDRTILDRLRIWFTGDGSAKIFNAYRTITYNCIFDASTSMTVRLSNTGDTAYTGKMIEDFIIIHNVPGKIDQNQAAAMDTSALGDFKNEHFPRINGWTNVYTESEFERMIEYEEVDAQTFYIVENDERNYISIYFGEMPLNSALLNGLYAVKTIQSAYDALANKDENTLYIVLPDEEEVSS